MQMTFIVLGLAASIALLSSCTTIAEEKPADGFAVVELFTSEGCSSCPPADAAAADLIAASAGKRVYVLAFHVDYWDHLGWTDPFADKAFSERQRNYAGVFHLDSIFTPQAIVNGRKQLVASDRNALKAAVDAAVSAAPAGTLSASAKRTAAGFDIDIATDGLPRGSILTAALVEDGLSSDVKRGENRGKTLKHEHVVRAFKSTEMREPSHLIVTLPVAQNVVLKQSAIIVYAQRPNDMNVLAAVEVQTPK